MVRSRSALDKPRVPSLSFTRPPSREGRERESQILRLSPMRTRLSEVNLSLLYAESEDHVVQPIKIFICSRAAGVVAISASERVTVYACGQNLFEFKVAAARFGGARARGGARSAAKACRCRA